MRKLFQLVDVKSDGRRITEAGARKLSTINGCAHVHSIIIRSREGRERKRDTSGTRVDFSVTARSISEEKGAYVHARVIGSAESGLVDRTGRTQREERSLRRSPSAFAKVTLNRRIKFRRAEPAVTSPRKWIARVAISRRTRYIVFQPKSLEAAVL